MQKTRVWTLNSSDLVRLSDAFDYDQVSVFSKAENLLAPLLPLYVSWHETLFPWFLDKIDKKHISFPCGATFNFIDQIAVAVANLSFTILKFQIPVDQLVSWHFADGGLRTLTSVIGVSLLEQFQLALHNCSDKKALENQKPEGLFFHWRTIIVTVRASSTSVDSTATQYEENIDNLLHETTPFSATRVMMVGR